MMNDEIVIVGFPKCGTSALIKHYIEDPQVEVMRNPANGQLEVAWPLVKEFVNTATKGIRAHKFSSYSYNKKAIEYLRDENRNSKIVLCIRDLCKVLISWHNMHRMMATSGKHPQHFAFKEREFYANCSISEYYERFAKSRLKHDKYFNDLTTVFPKERLVVVSQERMAENMAIVGEFIKGIVSSDYSANTSAACSKKVKPHKGYADKNNIDVEESISKELKKHQNNLITSIKESGVHHYI